MASPQRFSEVTDPGEEPLLVDDGFEIVEGDVVTQEDAKADTVEDVESGGGGGAAGWILFGLLVTACTATVLLVGLPMHEELNALRADRQRLSAELKASQERESALAAEVETLDATRARLTATVAQKTVEVDDAIKVQVELKKALRDEIKNNEKLRQDSGSSTRSRKSRRR